MTKAHWRHVGSSSAYGDIIAYDDCPYLVMLDEDDRPGLLRYDAARDAFILEQESVVNDNARTLRRHMTEGHPEHVWKEIAPSVFVCPQELRAARN